MPTEKNLDISLESQLEFKAGPSIEDEAKALYPSVSTLERTQLPIYQLQRSAHITCARMYTGEIEKGREAIDILKALCALKKHKDTVGKDEYYQTAQPEIWKIAIKFLEKYNL